MPVTALFVKSILGRIDPERASVSGFLTSRASPVYHSEAGYLKC